jgi:hypothetical protein
VPGRGVGVRQFLEGGERDGGIALLEVDGGDEGGDDGIQMPVGRFLPGDFQDLAKIDLRLGESSSI